MSFLSHIEELARAAKMLSVAVDGGDAQGAYADPSGAEPHIRLDREGFCLQTAYRVWKDVFESEHCRDIASIHADLERQKLSTAVKLGARPGVMFGPAVPAFAQPPQLHAQHIQAPGEQRSAEETTVEPAAYGGQPPVYSSQRRPWFVEENEHTTRIVERDEEGTPLDVFWMQHSADGTVDRQNYEYDVLRALFFAREAVMAVASLREFLSSVLRAPSQGLSMSDLQQAIRVADSVLDAVHHDGALPEYQDNDETNTATTE